MKSILNITICAFLFALSIETSHAQLTKEKKEEINITSAFKPSIIKSSKIEFRPEAISRDTARYRFSYDPVRLSFNTPMSGFTIKPLAYAADKIQSDSNQLSVKLGYGNLNAPVGSISYSTRKQTQLFNFHGDYLSMKGKLSNQQHSIGTLGATFKNRVSENYQYKLGALIENFNYRTYGFDKLIYPTINDSELRQRFTNYKLTASLHNVAGEEGAINVNPQFTLDFLSTNAVFNAYNSELELPIDFKWKKEIMFNFKPSITWTQINTIQQVTDNVLLVKIPIGATVMHKNWFFDASALPVYFNQRTYIRPNILVRYALKDSRSLVKGGVISTFRNTQPIDLLMYNPFIFLQAISEIPVYEQHKVYAGVDWIGDMGLKIDFEAGYIQHKNLPIFINSAVIGKDFYTYYESSIHSLDIRANIKFDINENFSLTSDLRWMNFQNQKDFKKPFGQIPLELKLYADWTPTEKISIGFNTNYWTGTYAWQSGNTIKLKNVAELNMKLRYNFTEKWGFWFDLNNIANVQYQRWNQYTAYGFNFFGGVKYVLGNSTKLK